MFIYNNRTTTVVYAVFRFLPPSDKVSSRLSPVIVKQQKENEKTSKRSRCACEIRSVAVGLFLLSALRFSSFVLVIGCFVDADYFVRLFLVVAFAYISVRYNHPFIDDDNDAEEDGCNYRGYDDARGGEWRGLDDTGWIIVHDRRGECRRCHGKFCGSSHHARSMLRRKMRIRLPPRTMYLIGTTDANTTVKRNENTTANQWSTADEDGNTQTPN